MDQVVVYPERVELLYTVRDIPHAALFEPLTDDVALSCGGWDSYASLALPDGQVIPAVDYLLDGKAYDTITGPYARVFSVHLFRVAIPAGVTDLKMTLSCIGLARLDRAPLNWEIPFRLVP